MAEHYITLYNGVALFRSVECWLSKYFFMEQNHYSPASFSGFLFGQTDALLLAQRLFDSMSEGEIVLGIFIPCKENILLPYLTK